MEYLVQFKRSGQFWAFRIPCSEAASRFHDWVKGLTGVSDVYFGPY